MLSSSLSALSGFAVLSVLSVLSALYAPLYAQSIRAAGTIVGPDSAPVPGVRVVLHQVGRTLQGPVDSVTTDHRGRFRFVFRPDSSALYLFSARYAGIEYFSAPVHTNPERPDTAIRIVVYDTSSTAKVALEARHIVLLRPGEDGSRGVLDLIVLRNDGQLTRVAPDSSRPSWTGRLPRGTVGLEMAESDVSPEAVTRREDSLIVTAPLAPGEKQVTVQYLVPSNRNVLELPFTQPGTTVNVLAEERGIKVSGGTLTLADSQVIQGRSYQRWTGTMAAGSILQIGLPGIGRAPAWLLGALVAGVALVLVGAGWYFLRRRPVEPGPDSFGDLLDSIAALDARYLGREAETSASEWSSYQTDRARLKTQLEASLAVSVPNP